MTAFDTSHPYEPELRFACSVYIYTGFHFERHSHHYCELVLIQRGRFRVQTKGVEHILGPGDIILYPADTDHEEWVEGGRPVLTLTCAFLWGAIKPGEVICCRDTNGHIEELLAWLARECYAHWPLTPSTESIYFDLPLIESILAGFKHLSCHKPKDMDAQMGDLIRERLKSQDKSFGLPILHAILAELKRLSCHEPNIMVDQVRAFIRENLRNDFTLDDLIAVSGLSRSYFARQYRAITGRSPMEDARLMRVEEARRLIITSPLTLSEIAPMVGIANEFHLSRLLKTVLGVSVRDLRPAARS